MSYKGLKKAINRVPHKFLGKKSVDDNIIAQYETDIKTSIAGLNFLVLETTKLKSDWKSFFKNQFKIVDLFKVLTEPLEFKDIAKYNSYLDEIQEKDDLIHLDELKEIPESTKNQIESFQWTINELKETIDFETKSLEDSVKLRCKEMVKYLEAISKLIVKRDHKKQDFDRFTSKIEKLLKKTPPLSEKDQQNLHQSENSLEEARELFEALDEKVKLSLPHALSYLSEFLVNLLNKIYFENLDLYRHVNDIMMEFSREQGLRELEPYSYDDVVDNWEKDFMVAKIKIEGLNLLKDAKVVDKEMDDVSTRKRDKVKESLEKTGSATLEKTGNIFTKALHHNSANISLKLNIENPVKPFDRLGVFDQAADPLRAFVVYNNSNYIPNSVTKKPYLDYNSNNSNKTNSQGQSYWSKLASHSPLASHISKFGADHNSASPPPSSPKSSQVSGYRPESSRNSTISTRISSPIRDSESEISLDSLSAGMSPMDRKLAKVYNRYKRTINESPVISESAPGQKKVKDDDLKLLAEGEFSIAFQLSKLLGLFDSLDNNEHEISRKAVANFSFEGERPGDLSFRKGDEVMLLGMNSERENYDWWVGKSTDNRIGFVPSNFVSIV